MSKFEQVLTIRRSSVEDTLQQGFTPIVGTAEEKEVQFNEFFKSEEIVVGSRHWLEQDENFLQIIPSIVFRKPDGTVLNYQRAKGSGEGRLLGNYSVNVGGHVNLVDIELVKINLCTATNEIDIISTVWDGIYREVREELGIELDSITDVNYLNDYSEFKGIIYDSSNSVGRVHIGLLFVFDVEQDCEFDTLVAESEGMLLKGWWSPEDLLHAHDEFDGFTLENWAKIVLEYLYSSK